MGAFTTRMMLVAAAAAAVISVTPGQRARAGAGPAAPGFCPADMRAPTFATRRFDAGSVDSSRTFAAGHQWYFWNWFSGPSKFDHALLNGDGSASVAGRSGPNGQLATAAVARGGEGVVGTAFGGGFCVEAQIAYDSSRQSNSPGFPAFWAMAVEHLDRSKGLVAPAGQAPGTELFGELDFLEAYKRAAPQYLGSVLAWYGRYRQSCPGRVYCSRATSFDNDPGAFPSSVDWTKWQRVGAVLIPATADRPGSLRYFLNGVPIAAPLTWRKAGGDAPDLSRLALPDLMARVDRQRFVLILGSNGTPINVRSVVVYQRGAGDNLTG